MNHHKLFGFTPHSFTGSVLRKKKREKKIERRLEVVIASRENVPRNHQLHQFRLPMEIRGRNPALLRCRKGEVLSIHAGKRSESHGRERVEPSECMEVMGAMLLGWSAWRWFYHGSQASAVEEEVVQVLEGSRRISCPPPPTSSKWPVLSPQRLEVKKTGLAARQKGLTPSLSSCMNMSKWLLLWAPCFLTSRMRN